MLFRSATKQECYVNSDCVEPSNNPTTGNNWCGIQINNISLIDRNNNTLTIKLETPQIYYDTYIEYSLDNGLIFNKVNLNNNNIVNLSNIFTITLSDACSQSNIIINDIGYDLFLTSGTQIQNTNFGNTDFPWWNNSSLAQFWANQYVNTILNNTYPPNEVVGNKNFIWQVLQPVSPQDETEYYSWNVSWSLFSSEPPTVSAKIYSASQYLSTTTTPETALLTFYKASETQCGSGGNGGSGGLCTIPFRLIQACRGSSRGGGGSGSGGSASGGVSGYSGSNSGSGIKPVLFDRSSWDQGQVSPIVANLIEYAALSWENHISFDPDVADALRSNDPLWNGIVLNSYTEEDFGPGFLASCGVSTAISLGGLKYNALSFDLNINTYYYPNYPVNWANVITHEDRKSTRLNSSHVSESRMPSSA